MSFLLALATAGVIALKAVSRKRTAPAGQPAAAQPAVNHESPSVASPTQLEVTTTETQAAPALGPAPIKPVADRVMVMELAAGWSVVVRLYLRGGVAKRALRCVNDDIAGRLVSAYGAMKFEMTDMSLSGGAEAVMRATEIEGVEAVEHLLKGLDKPVPNERRVLEPVAAVAEVPPVRTDPVQPPAPSAPHRASRVVGVLVEAGPMPLLTGEGTTFTVVLDVGGVRKEFRGKALQELFAQGDIAVGQRIAITPLGTKEVPIPDRNGGVRTISKNAFAVERV